MSSGGRVSIPNSVRKTIQNIKEITGNHSDEDIYATLKECSMDPNETAQKLLFQDPFHEVKRKRDRKKENLNKESVESKWKPGAQGRGNRGGRGNYQSRHIFHDAGGGRNTVSAKENGINQVSDGSVGQSTQPTPPEIKNKETTFVASAVEAITQSQLASSALDLKEATSELEESHILNSHHVIIPNHLHVPETEKLGFCFGSFDASFGFNASAVNDLVSDKSPTLSETSEGIEESAEEEPLSALTKKFRDLMTEFQTLRQKIDDEYREVVERRVVTVTGTRPDEETINHLIETGNSEQIFQNAMQEMGRGQVLNTVEEIQERHDAVREIEKKLLDLHQVYVGLSFRDGGSVREYICGCQDAGSRFC